MFVPNVATILLNRIPRVHRAGCGNLSPLSDLLRHRDPKCSTVRNVRPGVPPESDPAEPGAKHLRRTEQPGVLGDEDHDRSARVAQM